MRYTVTYDKITYRAQKVVTCAEGCDRQLKRAKTFWATQNPFNKNAAGLPKSQEEITAGLRAQAEAWRQEPETCSHCHREEKRA